MQIEIYENYGVLGAEKRSVYTYGNHHATATAWEKMTVETPEGWEAWRNDMDEIIVQSPEGVAYTVNEVLAGDKEPVFYTVDTHGKKHFAVLRIVNCETGA